MIKMLFHGTLCDATLLLIVSPSLQDSRSQCDVLREWNEKWKWWKRNLISVVWNLDPKIRNREESNGRENGEIKNLQFHSLSLLSLVFPSIFGLLYTLLKGYFLLSVCYSIGQLLNICRLPLFQLSTFLVCREPFINVPADWSISLVRYPSIILLTKEVELASLMSWYCI
jgi:hypothetical protein